MLLLNPLHRISIEESERIADITRSVADITRSGGVHLGIGDCEGESCCGSKTP